MNSPFLTLKKWRRVDGHLPRSLILLPVYGQRTPSNWVAGVGVDWAEIQIWTPLPFENSYVDV